MTSLTPDRQGYLGNLQEKTLPELKDLLDRQKCLLKKEKFIQTLPDKGRKIRGFHDHLAQLVNERETRETIVSIGEIQPGIISVLQKPAERTTIKAECSFSKLRDTECFSEKCPVGNEDSNTRKKDSLVFPSLEDAISDSLQKMKVSDATREQVPHQNESFMNSYDRVIRKAEEKNTQKRQPFRPYRDLKVASIADMPEDKKIALHNKPVEHSDDSVPVLESKNSASDHMDMEDPGTAFSRPVLQEARGVKAALEKEGAQDQSGSRAAAPAEKLQNPGLSVSGSHNEDVFPTYHYQKTKLISMEESIQIQQEQQHKQEVLRAQQAAARLASSLSIKMDAYQPQKQDMEYREPQELDSDDDDDDADDADNDAGDLEDALEKLDS